MFDLNSIWLKTSYFALSHRQDFRKWYIILLIAVAVFFVVFAVTNAILYIVGTPIQAQQMIAMAQPVVDYPAVQQRIRPTGLDIAQASVIPAGEGIYDVVAPVLNPNDDWFATVSYTATLGSTVSEIQTYTLNPEAQGFLTVLGIAGAASLQPQSQLSIEDIEWQHVDYRVDRPPVNFSVEDISYQTLVARETTAHQVTASVTNDSFTSYYEVPFAVILYNGDQIVGINYVYVAPFPAGETKNITARWSTIGGAVTAVNVVPTVSQLDQSNIID